MNFANDFFKHEFPLKLLGLISNITLRSPQKIGYKPYKSGDIDFSNGHVTSIWSLDQRIMGVSYTKSAACLVWCPYIFCRLRHVLYLSHDPTRPPDVMHMYRRELVTACDHLKRLEAIDILIVKRKKASS